MSVLLKFEFGQYLYEIYNHGVELRVFKARVNLLLVKWMKELDFPNVIYRVLKLHDFNR